MLRIDSNKILDKYLDRSARDLFLTEVMAANEKFNLFSRQRSQSDLELLVAESLLLLECDLINDDSEPILDIGSGWGIPAIPLLLHNNEIDITLLERSQKKADFLRLLLSRFRLGQKVIQQDLLSYTPDSPFKVVLARQINLNIRLLRALRDMADPDAVIYSFRQTVPCKISGRTSSLSYKIDHLPMRRIIKIPIS